MAQLYPCAGVLRTVFLWSPAAVRKKCPEVLDMAHVPCFAERCPSIAGAWEGQRRRCGGGRAAPLCAQWAVRAAPAVGVWLLPQPLGPHGARRAPVPQGEGRSVARVRLGGTRHRSGVCPRQAPRARVRPTSVARPSCAVPLPRGEGRGWAGARGGLLVHNHAAFSEMT